MPGVVFHGVGSVWDSARNRVLCRFDNDRYETTDPREIEILIANNYKYDAPPEIVLSRAESEPEEREIVEQVKRTRGRPRNA